MLVTLAFTIASLLMWLEMRATVKLAEEGQRSWVLFDTIVWTEPPSNKPCEIILRVKNFGRIPATIFDSGFKVGIGPQSELDAFFKTFEFKTPPGVGSIGPNQSIDYKLKCGPFTEQELGSITTLQRSLYVVGFVRYADLYSPHRNMEHCVFWSPERNGYALCPTHNKYD